MDRTALLFGTCKTPAFKRGERTYCLLRDPDVLVFGWTDARIPWPRCYIAGTRAFGKGILVEEELARAIQHESGLALQHWWGVGRTTVNRWRRAFEVKRMDPEGSRRLIHNAALGGLNTRDHEKWSEARLWTPEELDLLGKLPDTQVTYWTGRTKAAKTRMRYALGLPAIRGKRGAYRFAEEGDSNE